MLKSCCNILLSLLWVLTYGISFGQSDDCTTAETILSGEGICYYNNGSSKDATQSQATCSGGGNADDDVWYKFVATGTETHITVNPSGTYDAVFQLFSGACGGLTSIVCVDAGGDNIIEETTATGLTIGNTYFIRVYDYGAGSGSDLFSICVWGVPPVTNNDECSAIALPEITPSCNYGTYTTIGANDSGEPAPGTCGSVGYSGGDVWFSAVVPSNGELEIYTFADVVADGAMALYSGSCGALTLISCNDDRVAGEFMPYIHETGLTVGSTVYIRFWEFGNDNPGKFGMCVTSPLNDLCADASLICDFNGYGGVTSDKYLADRPDNMFGNNELADGTDQPNGINTGGPFGTGHSVFDVNIENNSWIKFVANSPTAVLDVAVDICIVGSIIQMQIFSSDNCTNFVPVSNFLQTATSQTITATGLIPGDTYYLMIDGYNSNVCFYTISAVSGVQTIDVTSSAGTSVCPGQPSQLTAASTGSTVAYSWGASPGGAFGTGQQNEMVTITVPTVYTVTVTGYCNAAKTASITITPDKTVTADYYAATSPGDVLITPFPTTMSCDDVPIALWAQDSATAGAFISPALKFVFTTDANTVADNSRLEIFKDGVSMYVSNPLPANTILTLYGEHMSPTANYTFTLCDDANNGNIIWDVYDGNTSLLLGTDTLKTGNPCQTYGPFSPAGSATWNINTVPAALTQGDSGVAFFDPLTAGVGPHQITYSWDNSVGCSDDETKTITVVNPHNANWNSPGAICENSGILTLTDYIDASASSLAGVWSGTGVTVATFDPSGLNGNIAVTYTVSGVNCNDAVVHDIIVNAITSAVATTITACNDGTGSVAFKLSAEDNIVNGGSGESVTWFTDALATSSIGSPNAFSSGTATVYAVVTNVSLCTDTTAVSLILNPQPPLSTTTSSECNLGAGFGIFNLSTLDNTVNTGNGNIVTWFTDAGATLPIATTTAFQSGTATIFAVVTDGVSSCTDTINVGLTMLAQPTVNNLTPTICEDALGSGMATGIDLTSNNSNINSGGTITFDWFDNGFVAIASPANTTVTNLDVYNVSVSNTNGCVDTATVTYNVTGTIALSDPAITFCEDDFGLGTVQGVNLTTFNSSIYTGSGTETFVWFDDLAGTNNVPDETDVILDNGTYDTFVVSVTDGTCAQNITITATINNSPVTVPSSAELCDDQSGFGVNATFDLTLSDSDVNNSTANTVAWFNDVAALFPIATPTNFYTNPVTVYAIITDGNLCNDTTTLDLLINPLPLANVSTTNATCFGDANGTATATGSDGTGAYSFLWSAGSQTTATATGLDLGTYMVTISDAKSCSTTTQTTLTEPTILTITNSTITEPLCNSGSDGQIDITVSGGSVTGYIYTWDAGIGTATESGLIANTYNVTVVDTKGCSVSDAFVVGEPSAITLTTSVTDASCNGYNDGAVITNAIGGTSTLTFTWSTLASNSGTTSTINGLSANNYSITVEDNQGCTVTTTETVGEPPAITVTLDKVDLLCNGDGNGIVNTTVTGGTPAYLYNWSNGSKLQTLVNLSGGVYILTVTDAVTPTACFAIGSITVNEPSALAINSTITDVACAGGNIGEVKVLITGGTTDYSYDWDNGKTTASITGLTSGDYFLTVLDNNNCELLSSFSVGGSATALATTITQTNVSCNGSNNGDATIAASGGTTPYAFSWSTLETTNVISSLSATSYQVTASDFNGCSGVQSITITEPNVLTVTLSKTDLNCNGDSDGTINSTVTGGTTNYTYLWNNSFTTANLSDLSGGQYTVTVTDSALPTGCTNVASITINEPPVFNVATSSNNISCGAGNVGTITNTPSGGTTPYNFSWNTLQTEQSLTGLAPNTYSFTATDNKGCLVNGSQTITGSPDAISITTNSNDISCNGLSDGDASITITGGVSPYSYLWSTTETTASIVGLAAGDYELTITDDNGCKNQIIPASKCVQIKSALIAACGSPENQNEMFLFQVGQNDLDTNDLNVNWPNLSWNKLCTNPVFITNVNATITGGGFLIEPSSAILPAGANVLIISGSTPSMSNSFIDLADTLMVLFQCNQTTSAGHFRNYNSAGGIRTFSIDFGGGCSDQVSYDFGLLVGQNGNVGNTPSGDGASVLFNDNGDATYINENCTAPMPTNNIVFTINEPQPLSTTITPTDISCFGFLDGQAAVLASGGTSPYNYVWNSLQTTASITGLSAQTCSVTVTDNNSCVNSNTTTISEPSIVTITNSTVTNVLCNGDNNGTIQVEVTGGITNYAFNWSSAGSITSSQNGLGNGVESITVSDANNCTLIQSFTISEPPTLTLTVETIDISCNGLNNGVATAIALGGFGNFIYSWNTLETTSQIDALFPGAYTLTVTDSNNCIAIAEATVSEPSAITITSNQTNVLCFGESSGQSNVTVTGGVSGYTFFWTNTQTTQQLINVPAGIYSLQVTDSNTPVSCRIFHQITITEPSAIILTTTITETCKGSNTGTADVIASGGVNPYNYSWSNNQNGSNASNLIEGEHFVTATDNNGCKKVNSVSITSIPLPTVNTINPIICEDGDSLNFASNVDLTFYNDQLNSDNGITISWLDQNNLPIAVPDSFSITSGDKLFVIINDGTCSNLAEITFTTKPQAHVIMSGGGEVCKDGSNQVQVRFDFTGTLPITFTYTHDGENVQVQNLTKSYYLVTTDINSSGDYGMLVVVNGNGCANNLIEDTVFVTPVGPEADFIPNPDFGNPPLDVIFVNNSTNSGLETFYWQFGDGYDSFEVNPTYTYTEQGNYIAQLLVEDYRGCTDTASYIIQIGDSSYFEIPIVFTPNGDGINDLFKPVGYNIASCEGVIFNRWGEKMFIFDRLNMGWDGRTFAGQAASEGTYFYIIRAVGYDGVAYDLPGTLTLIK